MFDRLVEELEHLKHGDAALSLLHSEVGITDETSDGGIDRLVADFNGRQGLLLLGRQGLVEPETTDDVAEQALGYPRVVEVLDELEGVFLLWVETSEELICLLVDVRFGENFDGALISVAGQAEIATDTDFPANEDLHLLW